MEIDIRNVTEEEVGVIRVCDSNENYVIADVIVRSSASPQKCYIEDSGDYSALGIFNKTHAHNLIKGIQKAIDLGWFE